MNAALARGGTAEVVDLEVGGVRVTILPTASSRAERAPCPREGNMFLDLAQQVLDRFQPQALLTYGGHPVSLELMKRARAGGTPVVFHLHNFGYSDRRGSSTPVLSWSPRRIPAASTGAGSASIDP